MARGETHRYAFYRNLRFYEILGIPRNLQVYTITIKAIKMATVGTAVSQVLCEVAIGIPVEKYRHKLIQVMSENDDILIFPSESGKRDKHYFARVSVRECTCPGFYYHKCCKHCTVAGNIKVQREERKAKARPLRVLGVRVE